jgi:hypothetical protein
MDAIPDSLLSSLDTIGIKAITFGLVDPMGSPKYVKGIASFLQSKIFASSQALSSEMLIGTMEDLL